MDNYPAPTPIRFGLRSLFVLTAIVAAMCVWTVNSHKRRSALARINDYPRLSQNVMRAIYEYEQVNGTLPPAQFRAGNGTVHSWRVLLLPYLERIDPKRYEGAKLVYDQYSFSENWDGPNNKKLFNSVINFYACDPRLSKGNCNIFAVVDPRTIWPTMGKVSFKDVHKYSETIVLVHVFGKEVPWMEPRDLSIDDVLDLFAERSTNYHGMFQVAYADGSNYDIPDSFWNDSQSPEELLCRLTLADDTPPQVAQELVRRRGRTGELSRIGWPSTTDNPFDTVPTDECP